MTDISQFVQKALNGDSSAFDVLYIETRRAVYFTCVGFVKNEQNALDITQEVYLTAFEKLNTLSDPEKFASWVKRIAVNKCKNFLTRKNVRTVQSLDDDENLEELTDENILPEEYVENTEKRETVMKIVRSVLSDTLYQTVLMFYFDDMSIAEIAEIMDCPEGTVKYRLNAARAKIRRGVLEHEHKSGDTLYAVAGLPFLARLFAAECAKNPVPPITVATLLPESAHAAATAGAAKAVAVSKGGKALLGTLKVKIAAGVAAAAVAGGGAVAVVNIASSKSTAQSGVSQYSAAQSEIVSASISASASEYTSVISSKPHSFSVSVSVSEVGEPSVSTEFEYTNINGGVKITRYLGSAENVFVPAEINGKKVIAIGSDRPSDYVFYDPQKNDNIMHITLPEGLTTIDVHSFAMLKHLKSVDIPNSVTEIREFAFENCAALTDVTLPGGLAEISLGAFAGCTSLEHIAVPEGVWAVNGAAFDACISLKSVSLPQTLRSVCVLAFNGCIALREITLPDNISDFAPAAFNGCDDIKVTYHGKVYGQPELNDLLTDIINNQP